jgi:hypothetical protein
MLQVPSSQLVGDAQSNNNTKWQGLCDYTNISSRDENH